MPCPGWLGAPDCACFGPGAVDAESGDRPHPWAGPSTASLTPMIGSGGEPAVRRRACWRASRWCGPTSLTDGRGLIARPDRRRTRQGRQQWDRSAGVRRDELRGLGDGRPSAHQLVLDVVGMAIATRKPAAKPVLRRPDKPGQYSSYELGKALSASGLLASTGRVNVRQRHGRVDFATLKT